ncbi:replication-relaxation family protein [Leucobacter tenebrionis]|uniref:replication-relaxation family protein n=1 Tax=Leucobacter tenebrionis TaxID=2873270 RepID=UPI001CA77D17|nr:replication-relaxation family protein [Leucobacter tenebrionis]QZY52870.1 replication-relaxation family protein [Leucobacter tenebrionis]
MTPRTPYKIDDLLLHLTDRDLRVLEDLEQFRLLDTRLIQRLEFPVGSQSDGRPGFATQGTATRLTLRVLYRLEEHGVIARVGRRVGGKGHGSGQTVWQLAAAGERLLRARRGESGRRRYVDPGAGFLAHTLEVARYAATLHEKARSHGFDILDLQAEPASWRSFQAAHGGGLTLKPDLAIVTADTESETHSFVEIDRDTEHLPAVLRKSGLYQRYWESGAEQANQDGLFPLVVWTTPTTERADKIRRAIQEDRRLNAALFHAATAEQSLAVVAPYTSPNPKGGSL